MKLYIELDRNYGDLDRDYYYNDDLGSHRGKNKYTIIQILNEYDKLYCDYKELEQEKDKQKELIDKIIKHCEEEIIAINCGHIETRSLRGQLKNILDLIKEYRR